MNWVTPNTIIATKRVKTAVTGIPKRHLKQALEKQRLKCRETETVNLNRSWLRRTKQR